MWERYCPTIQRGCTDGIPDGQQPGQQLMCVFWDSVDAKCNFAAGISATRSYEEMLIEPMRKYMQEAGRLQDAKEALNRNFDESIAKARGVASHKEAEHHETGAS